MSDLISRQAAINELKKISFSHWFECGEYLSEDTREIEIINSNKALEAIEELPSAQPDMSEYSDKLWKAAYERGKAEGREKRKKGHWILIAEGSMFPFMCDQCKERQNGASNFCPECGADMQEQPR